MKKNDKSYATREEEVNAFLANNTPSVEELAEFSGESEEEVKELMTSPETSDDEYRKKVLSDPKKVRVIRKSLRNQKQGLDMKLALLDQMYKDEDFGEVSPEEHEALRQEKIDEERAKVLVEYTRIENALFTTRQGGKFVKSPAYEWNPHVGLNRRQRRLMTK